MPKLRVVNLLAAGGLAVLGVAAPAAATTNAGLVYAERAVVQLSKDPQDYELPSDLRAIGPDGANDRAVTATPKAFEMAPAPSPDGTTLVYVRGDELWRSAIDGSGAQRIRKDEDLDTPMWSPDGSAVVYSYTGDARDSGGLALVGPLVPKAKRRVVVPGELSINGKPFTSVVPGELDLDEIDRISGAMPLEPTFTPDGRAMVYVRAKIDFAREFGLVTSVWTANVDGTGARRLFRGSGKSRLILDVALSPSGTQLVYLAAPGSVHGPRRLFVANLDGSQARQFAITPNGRWSFSRASWSPDGTRIAVGVNHENPKRGAELWSIDVATGAHAVLKKIASGQIDDPAWVAAP